MESGISGRFKIGKNIILQGTEGTFHLQISAAGCRMYVLEFFKNIFQ